MGFRSLVFFRGPVSATCTDFVVESAKSLYFLKLNLQRTRAWLHKNLHLSCHLSRSLTNPLWVHLRVLHGTHS